MEFIVFPSTQLTPTQVHLFQNVRVLRPSQLRFVAEEEAKERGKAYDMARGLEDEEEGVEEPQSLGNPSDGSNGGRRRPHRFNPYYPVPPQHSGLLSGGTLRRLCLAQLLPGEVEMAKTIIPERLHLLCVQPPLPPLYGYDVWTTPSASLFPSPPSASTSSSSSIPTPFSSLYPTSDVPVTRPQPCVLKALAAEELAEHYFPISDLLQPNQLFVFTCWDNLEVFAQAYQLICTTASAVFPLPCLSFPTHSTAATSVMEEAMEHGGHLEDGMDVSEDEEGEGIAGGRSERVPGSAMEYENDEGGEVLNPPSEMEARRDDAEEGMMQRRMDASGVRSCPPGEETEDGEAKTRREGEASALTCTRLSSSLMEDGGGGDAGSAGEGEGSDEGKRRTPGSLETQQEYPSSPDSMTSMSTPTRSSPSSVGKSKTVSPATGHHSSSSSTNLRSTEFPAFPLYGSGTGVLRGGKRGREEGGVASHRVSPSTSRTTGSVLSSHRRGRDESVLGTVCSAIQPSDIDVLNRLLDEEVTYLKEMEEDEEDEEDEEEEEVYGVNTMEGKQEGKKRERHPCTTREGVVERGKKRKPPPAIPLLSSYWGRIIAPFLCQACHRFPFHTYTMRCCGAVTCHRCSTALSEVPSQLPFSAEVERGGAATRGSSIRVCNVCHEEPLSPPQHHPKRDQELYQLVKELNVLYFPQFQQQQQRSLPRRLGRNGSGKGMFGSGIGILRE